MSPSVLPFCCPSCQRGAHAHAPTVPPRQLVESTRRGEPRPPSPPPPWLGQLLRGPRRPAQGGARQGAQPRRPPRRLADRGRVFDLFEMLMGGKLPEALAEFQAQYELGADPAVIIADLAELTHWITRLKYVPGVDEDVSFSQSARARGRSAAEMLSTRVLSRAWQVLLKGHEETQTAFNTRAAAEMILIRLAHMADTPTPDELVRQYESAKPAPTPPASASPAPASSTPSAPE